MAVYLLAPDSATGATEGIKAKLRSIVSDLVEVTSLEQIAAALGRHRDHKTIVIFVSPVLAKSGFDNLVNLAVRYRDEIFFLLVSNEISAIDYKSLVRSGGADWVPAGGGLDEVPELLSRQIHSVSADVVTRPEMPRAMVVSFVPAAGGVGNTSIALEVALQIRRAKRTKNWKICYFDLDFQTSHVSDLLDTEPRLQIEDIVDHPERLDDQLFELFVNHHGSGLDIVATPKSKTDPCNIGVAALDVLLDRIVNKYDLVVLDLPVFWFSWTIPTLQNSDVILITAVNSVPSLRQLRLTLNDVLQAKSPSSQLAVIINRVENGLFGGVKRRQRVEKVIGGQKVFFVHEDPQAVVRADRGLPAGLGGPGRFLKDFTALADFCSGSPTEKPQIGRPLR